MSGVGWQLMSGGMRFGRKHWLTAGFFSCALIVSLSGCQSQTPTVERLRERAMLYWEARQLRDLHTLYQMDARTAKEKILPHESSARAFPSLMVVKFDLTNPRVKGEEGTVEVATTITFPDLNGKTMEDAPTVDRWVWVGEDWYHVPMASGGLPEK